MLIKENTMVKVKNTWLFTGIHNGATTFWTGFDKNVTVEQMIDSTLSNVKNGTLIIGGLSGQPFDFKKLWIR